MSVVVTDTSPLNYLVQIGQEEVLGRLFGKVILPRAVLLELQASRAPTAVRKWASALPGWIEVKDYTGPQVGYGLDLGETEAIAIALDLNIRTVIMDERKGRRVAEENGLLAIGTLTLIEIGDAKGLLNYEETIQRLKNTNFHGGEKLLAASLERVRRQRAERQS